MAVNEIECCRKCTYNMGILFTPGTLLSEQVLLWGRSVYNFCYALEHLSCPVHFALVRPCNALFPYSMNIA